MSKPSKSQVSADRFRLGNQYAHIEYLEELAANEALEASPKSLAAQISASRELLQNPYAYSDEHGYSASVKRQLLKAESGQSRSLSSLGESPNQVRRRTEREIEAAAKECLANIWRERASLWGNDVPTNPVDLIEPAIALHTLGYELKYEDTLGVYSKGGRQIDVAGLIDRTTRRVRISCQFPISVQVFTAAHELGHAVLHGEGVGVHRDRPLDGTALSRDVIEWEADKFATYFLMPANLVRNRFVEIFRTGFFCLTNETAFALCQTALDDAQTKIQSRRDLSRLLAKTDRYNGRYFTSLASQFRVSVEAMAIRLEELNLV